MRRYNKLMFFGTHCLTFKTIFPISRQNSFELLVPLNAEKEARGKLFWDDGESLDTVENGLYQISTFEFQTVG